MLFYLSSLDAAAARIKLFNHIYTLQLLTNPERIKIDVSDDAQKPQSYYLLNIVAQPVYPINCAQCHILSQSSSQQAH